MTLNKFLIFIALLLIGLWIASLVFNHIHAWIGFGLFVAVIVGAYVYSSKQIKNQSK